MYCVCACSRSVVPALYEQANAAVVQELSTTAPLGGWKELYGLGEPLNSDRPLHHSWVGNEKSGPANWPHLWFTDLGAHQAEKLKKVVSEWKLKRPSIAIKTNDAQNTVNAHYLFSVTETNMEAPLAWHPLTHHNNQNSSPITHGWSVWHYGALLGTASCGKTTREQRHR